MVTHSTAYVLLVINMAVWGASMVVARAAHDIVPPFALTFWRFAVSALVLSFFVWRTLPAELGKIRESRSAGQLFKLSAFIVAGNALSVLAVNYTTAINASLINGAQPTLTALVAFLFAREGLSFRQLLGVGAAFLGIVVMVSEASLGALLRLEFSIGDPIMFIGVVSWAFYAVELHRTPHLPGGDVLLFIISCVGALVALPLYLVEGSLVRPFVPTSGGLMAVAYLSLGSTLLAVYLWNLSIRSVGANRAAVFVNLIPVFGAMFAILFIGERLFGYHIVGAALVFLGIFLAVRWRDSEESIRA